MCANTKTPASCLSLLVLVSLILVYEGQFVMWVAVCVRAVEVHVDVGARITAGPVAACKEPRHKLPQVRMWLLQEYLVAVRGFCSNLTSTRLQQLTAGQVQRLPDFLASQQIKHTQSAKDLDTFGGMVIGAVAAACHAALEQSETQLSQV